jgi:hypothetical protein
MHVLALDPAQVAHAVKRFQAYRNSPARIARHFRNRGELARERICRGVHAVELELGIDLGALCARFAAREEAGVSPFERAVLEHLAEWADVHDGRASQRVLLIHVERVRALNRLPQSGGGRVRPDALFMRRVLEKGTEPV